MQEEVRNDKQRVKSLPLMIDRHGWVRARGGGERASQGHPGLLTRRTPGGGRHRADGRESFIEESPRTGWTQDPAVGALAENLLPA